MLSNTIGRKTVLIHVANLALVVLWLAAIPWVIGGKQGGFLPRIPIPTARRMMVFGFVLSFTFDFLGTLAAWRHREVRSLFLLWFIIQFVFFVVLMEIFSGFGSTDWIRNAF